MKWVKASERLPGWNKEVKWRHPSAEITNELMWTSVAMELCSHLITDLEWLDVSGSEPEGKEAVELRTDKNEITRLKILIKMIWMKEINLGSDWQQFKREHEL